MLKKFKTLKTDNTDNLIPKKNYSKYLTISYTKNNTFVTYYNTLTKKIHSMSAGQIKEYGGFEKKTAIASETVINKLAEFIQNKKLLNSTDKLVVHIKGVEKFKTEVIQTLINQKLPIALIEDKTGTPHGGCRPPKKRRK
jgi:small subunit ribosomal protein S11